jgi:hypothetical protein
VNLSRWTFSGNGFEKRNVPWSNTKCNSPIQIIHCNKCWSTDDQKCQAWERIVGTTRKTDSYVLTPENLLSHFVISLCFIAKCLFFQTSGWYYLPNYGSCISVGPSVYSPYIYRCRYEVRIENFGPSIIQFLDSFVSSCYTYCDMTAETRNTEVRIDVDC